MSQPFWKHPFVLDAAERAGKSALQGFVVGTGIFTATEGTAIALTNIQWAVGLNVAGGMAIASIITSLLSYRRGPGGTASATKVVEYVEHGDHDGTLD